MTSRHVARSWKPLVVAAWEPELERFRALVEAATEPHLNIDAVGIGVVDAAMGMTRSLFRHSPTHVVLLGTCGASPTSNLAIGDVTVANEVRLVDPAVVEGRAAMPFGTEALPLDHGMVEVLCGAGARPAKVVNPLGITTDDALATRLSAFGDVEHLEAYGVARACQAAGVPCTVVLGVANIVGACGREQWRSNHVAASARAAEVAHLGIRMSTRARSPA